MRAFLIAIVAAAAGLAGGHVARAQTVDPLALYEQRCVRCHERDAGDFGATRLKLLNGELIGVKKERALDDLLPMHYGVRLDDDQIAALVGHFGAVLTSDRVYREKCSSCHDRAAELARTELIEREGALIGRYSGRDMEVFLANHGRLTPDEVPTITAMLRRQLATRPD